MIDFFPKKEVTSSSCRRFGICDTPAPSTLKAYIAEREGKNWIAIVENGYRIKVNFVPIDHCIELLKPDNKMDSRCDECLFYEQTIIFVELKQRKGKGNHWIKDAEQQLRITIGHFEKEEQAQNFQTKKAYIANSEKPLFNSARAERMDNFFSDTGYILRIENKITIE